MSDKKENFLQAVRGIENVALHKLAIGGPGADLTSEDKAYRTLLQDSYENINPGKSYDFPVGSLQFRLRCSFGDLVLIGTQLLSKHLEFVSEADQAKYATEQILEKGPPPHGSVVPTGVGDNVAPL